jgi:DNA segregation ATPase FtsK/SpoIIIE-like protein
MALSAIGIGVTNFKPAGSFWYWASMAPVFAAVSIYMGWSKARRRGEGMSRIIRVQVLHWIGLLAALVLIYFLFKRTGRIDYNQLALISLLALALTTFLAGVHFDWRFMVVGIVLGACVAGAAFVEQVVWMIVIPIVVAIVLIVFWWKRSL